MGEAHLLLLRLVVAPLTFFGIIIGLEVGIGLGVDDKGVHQETAHLVPSWENN